MIESLIYGGVVGFSLGMTGGGGSIFAVPLLVYGLGLDFRRAVTLSLAVVGLTALYGAIIQARRGHVLWGAGAVLGIGGVLAAPLGAWLGARIPDRASLLLFSALMVTIGVRMLLRRNATAEVPLSWVNCQRQPDGKPHFSMSCALKLLVAGIVTGILSGVFGVGGGFLVVPVLLVVTCVSMERALATSLVGIFLIAASGFAANATTESPVHSLMALQFLAGSAIGMTAGTYFKTFISPRGLQILFAIAVLAMAAYVAVRNF